MGVVFVLIFSLIFYKNYESVAESFDHSLIFISIISTIWNTIVFIIFLMAAWLVLFPLIQIFTGFKHSYDDIADSVIVNLLYLPIFIISRVQYLFGYSVLRNLLLDVKKHNLNVDIFIHKVVSFEGTGKRNKDFITIKNQAIRQIEKVRHAVSQAINLESLKRYEPQCDDSQFLTLVNFSESLKVASSAFEQSKVFGTNLEIALSVEREMRKLINKK